MIPMDRVRSGFRVNSYGTSQQTCFVFLWKSNLFLRNYMLDRERATFLRFFFARCYGVKPFSSHPDISLLLNEGANGLVLCFSPYPHVRARI